MNRGCLPSFLCMCLCVCAFVRCIFVRYFGGVVSFSSSDYKRINGFPNSFWGWGGEDDAMQKRLERLGMHFAAPDKGTLVDLEEMTLKEKLDFLRENRNWKCMVRDVLCVLSEGVACRRVPEPWKWAGGRASVTNLCHDALPLFSMHLVQVKWEALAEDEGVWKQNGLSDLKYSVLKTQSLDDNRKATRVTVDIRQDGSVPTDVTKARIEFVG